MSQTEYIVTDTGKQLLRFLETNPEAINRFKRPATIPTLVQVANEGPLTDEDLDEPQRQAHRTLMSLRVTGLVETI